MEEKKENNEIDKKNVPSNNGYKEGAIAGGLVGLVIAAGLKKNIMLGAIIGIIGGGYIGYIIKKPENQDQKTKLVKPKNIV